MGKTTIQLNRSTVDRLKTLKKYERESQKPNFYYSFHKLITSKKTNPILKALNVTKNNKTELINKNKNFTIGNFLDDNSLSINQLSSVCLDVFNGNIKMRSAARDLDFVAYGNKLIDKKDKITNELIKLRSDYNKKL